MADMVGVGVLTTAGFMALELSPGLILLDWVLGGVVAIAGSLAYAALASLVPRSGAGDTRDATIDTVSLSFRDPETDELVQDTVSIGYPEPLHTLRDDGYFAADDVADAHKSFVMFSIFVGMEEAISAFHSRRANAQTIAELDTLIAAVEDYNQELEDKDIELDLELLEMLRANMLRSGIRSATVTPRADPWPCD